MVSSATGSAQARVTLDGSAGAVTRVRITVSAGEGPPFSAISVDLSKSVDGWRGYITGIPVGPGRRFDVVALDTKGATILSGTAATDIVANELAMVMVVLKAPPLSYQAAVPQLDYVTASATSVGPGAQVSVRVAALSSLPLTYLWTSTCGAFDAPSAAFATWTAPPQGGISCVLSITVSDGSGDSVATSFAINVTGGRTISGSCLVTYWPDPPAPQVTVPSPGLASATTPVAVVSDNSGNWTVYRGGSTGVGGAFVADHFGSDGTFMIPDVPPGPYVLCYAPPGGPERCTDTSADLVDLGYDVLGRPDQTSPTDSTPVTLVVSGLDPWNPLLEEIQITSSGANLWDGSLGAFRGGTTSGNLLEDWYQPMVSERPLNLLSGPDVLFVHQLSARPLFSGNTVLFYTAATRATPGPPTTGALTGVELQGGKPTTVVAPLAPLALTSAINVQWSPGKFEIYAPELGPPSRLTLGEGSHELRVGANAFSLDYPAPSAQGSPELLKFELPTGAGDVSGTLEYGQFLPSFWNEWQGVRFSAPVTYLADGAESPLFETAEIEQRDPLPTPGGAIVPAISPVVSIQINGGDAFLDNSGVTTTPTFLWSPPEVGQPTAYVIEVFSLVAAGQSTSSSLVLRYSTRSSRISIPPGILTAGGSYYAKVTAEVSAIPYDTAPFRTANVFARATSLTGTFQP